MGGARSLVHCTLLEFDYELDYSVSEPVTNTSIAGVMGTDSLGFSCPALTLIPLIRREIERDL